MSIVVYVILALAFLLFLSSIRIVQQYEIGVVIRFGRVVGIRSAGLKFVIPFIETVKKINTQVQVIALDPQEVMTKDSVSVKIEAVVYYRVSDAQVNYSELDDDYDAINQRAQGIMRRIIGQHTLADLLEHGDNVSQALTGALANATNGWGLNINDIEVKDVELPESMRRAMASKAEATREAEAKIIAAEGEKNSAKLLREAADELSPAALRLRELQTLREIGTDNAAIVVTTIGGETAAMSAAGQLAGERVGASTTMVAPPQ